MNAADMARRGLADGGLVRVESRRGAIHVVAQADESLRSGQVWLPMHWGKRFLGGRASAGVNTLTSGAVDPLSRQPELKHAAVRVAAASLPWRALAFAELDGAGIERALRALHGLQDEVTFLAVAPAGRERPSLVVRIAHAGAPPADWIAKVDALLGLDAPEVLRYDDAHRGHSRRIRLGDGRLIAARLSGAAEVVERAEWLRDWMLAGEPVEAVRRFLLSPAKPGTQRGRNGDAAGTQLGRNGDATATQPVTSLVCQCFGMTASQIEQGLARGEKLECGTNCGSCLPEVRAIAARVGPNARRMVA